VQDYGRRIIIDSTFDRTVEETVEAFQSEGLDIVGRVDLRDYARRQLHHDFRRYVLLQALPARLTVDALRRDLDVGTVLPAIVAIYELADGETAVVAGQPFASVLVDPQWQTSAPELANVATQESEQVARALMRLQHEASHRAAAASAS